MVSRATKPAKIPCCDITFDGLLIGSVKATLVVETLKYLVHQRNQIPLPFEHIKRECMLSEPVAKLSDEAYVTKKARSARMEYRKCKEVVASLEQIFSLLHQTFALVHPVKQILILFGPTIVSPKEFYVLQFPTGCYDGKSLSWKACRTQFFHTLISSDIFQHAKDLKTVTKLTVMVQAPRDCNAAALGLIPKPMFKIPRRGTHFQLNFLCKGKIVEPNFSHVSDTSFDISGIEPFEKDSQTLATGVTSLGLTGSYRNDSGIGTPNEYTQDPNMYASPTVSFSSTGPHGDSGAVSELNESTSSCSGMLNKTETEIVFKETDDNASNPLHLIEPAENLHIAGGLGDDEDYMWFQLPTVLQGYKDKTSKLACCDTTTL